MARCLCQQCSVVTDKKGNIISGGSISYEEENYREPCAFLVGNEGRGLSDETAELADACVRIPMEGQLESLNAAMAAGILLYEGNRQRRKEKG